MALNTGDGAILFGLVSVLKRAFGHEIEITVLDRHGSVPQRYYPEVTFKQAYAGKSLPARLWRRLDVFKLYPRLLARLAAKSDRLHLKWLLPRDIRKNLEEFRSADLVVSAGGTYLVEHYHLELNLLQLALSATSGTPTVMFTQSLGPFRNSAVKEWIRQLFPRMTLILLRDGRSEANLIDAGVPTANMRIVPDGAFALANLDELAGQPPRRIDSGLRVAVSVRSWMFPKHASPHVAAMNFRRSIGEMVTHLVRSHGARVTFISTCQGVPEYGYDDSLVAREILASLPEDIAPLVAVDSGFHRPEALRDILAQFDLIIATRMHVAILGLCAGTPVLPIAYEFKTEELFTHLGLGEWVLDINSLQPKQSVATLEKLVKSLEYVRSDMLPRIVEQHERAMSIVGDLRRIVSPVSENVP